MPTPGTAIGNYEIVSLISAGGMGELYRAHDPELGRDLVLKLLPRRGVFHPDAVDRFVREARASSALNHPNIVTVYEVGESPTGHFIAMELIEGTTLRELRHESQPIATVARIGSQIARALGVAHGAGIIHRDIKPENLMVREDGYVKVLDFGIAQLGQRDLSDADSNNRITQSGMVVGTLRYMSPEQATNREVSASSDIFSLGIVLYELAVGRHPFDSSSDMAVLSAIILREAVPPSRMNARIPPALDTLIMRMLSKDPAERPTAPEVADTLDGIAALRTTSRHMSSGVIAQQGVIGRDAEVGALREAFDSARASRASLICVSGEPGIGKTTLVETFLRSLYQSGTQFVALGRCSERLAGAEAYLPLLDSIEDLLHEDGAAELSGMLHNLAPTWHQMLAAGHSTGAEDGEAHAQSQERMKRELAAFLGQVCTRQPLVLLIEDIHWADVSTVDALGYLLTRLRDSRLLAVATYRPSELQLSAHPFIALKLDLQTRGAAREIPLNFLTEEYVGSFIADRFPKNDFPRAFTGLVHSRTEGSPLFVEDLLRYLRSRGTIAESGETWSIHGSLPDLESDIPESMRSMVERKVGQLAPEDRSLLAAASVQGHSFDSAIVAHALGLDIAGVEDKLAVLDRVHGFVRRAGEREFHGGGITGRYRFVHVLYQNSLYASLPVSRRVALSKGVGEALLALNGGTPGTAAADLGFLFETAREFERAAGYFALATEASLGVFAFDEATRLAKRALALIARLAPTPELKGLELGIQLMLGSAAGVAGGYAAADARAAMARARTLAEEMGSAPSLAPALWGLFAYYLVSGEVRNAVDIAMQSLAHANQSRNDMSRMAAHTQAAISLHFTGRHREAVEHFEQAAAIYDPALQHQYYAVYHMDPGVFALAEMTRALWSVGRVDEAVATNERMLALARSSPDPRTVAFSLLLSSVLNQLIGEVEATLSNVNEGMIICDEHEIVLERAWIMTSRGWARTQLGELDKGVEEMVASMAMRMRMNAVLDTPFALCQIASGFMRQSRFDKARETLMDAVDHRDRFDDAWFEADVHRMLGDLEVDDPGGNPEAAEAAYQKSLGITRERGTRSFELRSALSYAQLMRKQGRAGEAVALLEPILDWFRGQRATRDFTDADALVTELRSRS